MALMKILPDVVMMMSWCHDFAVVGIWDGFPYQLLKSSKDPFTTTEWVKEGYLHYISANKNALEEN